jgi:hypothetical protein
MRAPPHRTLPERLLDRPERIALWLPWPENGRIVVRGLFGFLRQVVRSRSLPRAGVDPR